MGLSEYIVGPVEPFSNGLNADLGALLLLLHNGKPHKVIAPGTRLRRLLNTPWSGNLQIMQIKTSDIVLILHYSDLPTKKEDERAPQSLHVQSVKVEAAVKLNPHEKYKAFSDFIASAGAGFADRLQINLVRDLEARLRSSFAAHTVGELRSINLSSLILEQNKQLILANGLLQVKALRLFDVVWPVFSESVAGAYFEEKLGLIAAENKKVVGVAMAEAEGAIKRQTAISDAEVSAARTKAYYQLAEDLGVPVAYVMNPDFFTEQVEAAREFLKIIAGSSNPRIWRDAAGAIASALHASGMTPHLPVANQLQGMSDEDITAATQALSRNSADEGDIGEDAGNIELAEILTGVIEIDHQLNKDAKILRAWQSVFGMVQSQLRGSGLHVEQSTAFLVVVARNANDITPEERQEFAEVVRSMLSVDKVRFTPLHPDSYGGLAKQLMEKVLGEKTGTLRITEEITGPVPIQELQLYVDSTEVSPREAVRTYKEEYRNEHHALQDLLPFTATHISAGTPGTRR